MESTVQFRAGTLRDTLATLQEKIRHAPGDADLRLDLFAVLCALGQWSRAYTQLGVLRDFGGELQMFATVFDRVVACELVRADVFAGTRTPLIFGEPPAWVGGLVQALTLGAQGHWGAAAPLRAAAVAAAPAIGGKLNDTVAFTLLGDADSRLGPVLEAIVNGKYYWVPFERIAEITLRPPAEPRDLIWAQAHFVWQGGGESDGFIPVRYPGSESWTDDAALRARATSWVEQPGEAFCGVGQRLLATEQDDYPLLELRRVQLEPAATHA